MTALATERATILEYEDPIRYAHCLLSESHKPLEGRSAIYHYDDRDMLKTSEELDDFFRLDNIVRVHVGILGIMERLRSVRAGCI